MNLIGLVKVFDGVASVLTNTGTRWVSILDLFKFIGESDSPLQDQVESSAHIRLHQGIPYITLDLAVTALTQWGHSRRSNELRDLIDSGWTNWVSNSGKEPEDPARGLCEASASSLGGALRQLNEACLRETGVKVVLTQDYVYTRLMSAMGLETNIDVDDLTTWELNYLSLMHRTLESLIHSYLRNQDGVQDQIAFQDIIPHLMGRIYQMFFGISMTLDYLTQGGINEDL